MKYALLIYSPTTADEYSADLDRQRALADTERGPWVDYTRAAREAGALVGAEQLTHSETATQRAPTGRGPAGHRRARSWRPRSTCSGSTWSTWRTWTQRSTGRGACR